MDLFDSAILNLLRDAKPREFQEILTAVKFSHNTLRQHLDYLLDQSFITRDKRPNMERGKPRYVYSVPAGKGKAPAVIPNPSTGVVSLSFSRLSQFCRFERVVSVRRLGVSVAPGSAPKSGNIGYDHFKPN